MLRKTTKAWLIATALAATATATLAVTIAIADPDSRHKDVAGTFTATPASGGPDCPSPVDLCASGTFRGAIRGPATAVARSVTPTSEPGVIVAVVDLVIHDRRGDLRCTEIIVVNTTPGSDSEEGWICEIKGGTGRWAKASGHIEAYGSAPPGQEASGRYAGRLTVR
jgi:hypothetical protein